MYEGSDADIKNKHAYKFYMKHSSYFEVYNLEDTAKVWCCVGQI
jgi:hypothetical protein